MSGAIQQESMIKHLFTDHLLLDYLETIPQEYRGGFTDLDQQIAETDIPLLNNYAEIIGFDENLIEGKISWREGLSLIFQDQLKIGKLLRQGFKDGMPEKLIKNSLKLGMVQLRPLTQPIQNTVVIQ